MKLTITAASTALFSTWVFIEELGLLFDAGDGVSATLTQKCGKIRHVFITHADRDHVCGLLQLHQLNAREGRPAIYYPRDSGSFPVLRDFVARFDPQSGPATWIGLQDQETIELDKKYAVQAHPSGHIASGQQVKALGYTLLNTRRQLRQSLRGLSGKGIAEKRQLEGEDAITDLVIDKPIGFSGDTPALIPEQWAGVKVLLHEATFLSPDTTRGQHANVEQVIRAASSLEFEALVLMHFSARYRSAEIVEAIQNHANFFQPGFPIYAVMPGQVHRDVLSQAPVWEP